MFVLPLRRERAGCASSRPLQEWSARTQITADEQAALSLPWNMLCRLSNSGV